MNGAILPPESPWVGSKENLLLLTGFIATCVLFGLGLVLPMMTLTKFYVLENTVSLLSSLVTLFISGSWILFLAIFGFSILVPLLKLRLIYILIRARGRIDATTQRWLKLMHDHGRWGMLDVFVVAVILVVVKLGAIASVEVHLGLYCFGAAVLAMMVLTHRLSRIYEPIEESLEGQPGDGEGGSQSGPVL